MQKTFLFLQGPISPFFSDIATELNAKGHKTLKINLCFGDRMFWQHPGATNYRKSQEDWPAFIAAYLDDNAITDIVFLGEQRYYHKVAAEVAKARDVQIIATDFGYLRPDWITLERNGLSGGSGFPREPQAIRHIAQRCPERDLKTHYTDCFPRMAYWDILYHLSSSLMWLLYPHYKSHQLHHPILVYLGTGIRLLKSRLNNRRANRAINALLTEKTPFFFFPLQMATDFSIRAYSHYPNLQAVLDEILQSFAAHAPRDCKLVIKIHPMDPGLENWGAFIQRSTKKLGIADRVVFLHGGDLVKVLTHSQGTVVVNSTVGLTALSLGVPLKLLAQAIYNVEGLICSASLDEFWQNPTKPDADLCEDFLRAIAGTLMVRGTFYNRPGLDVGVHQAACRLDQGLINEPVDFSALQNGSTRYVKFRKRSFQSWSAVK